jgi:hypothetical protein
VVAFVALVPPAWTARADPALTISPAMAMVSPRGTQTFAASGGSGTGYTWSLMAAPSGGVISGAGVYTAGALGGVTDVVAVVDSDSNMQTAQVTVGGSVTITPASAMVVVGASAAFTASGGSPPYTWSLTATGSMTSSASPSVSSMGAYTAGGQAGTDTVEATDSLGNFATATVTVGSAPKLGAGCLTSSNCPPASDGNRYCVDFVCCDSACSGQCQACNLAGSVGTCATVTGPPVGTRPSCSGGASTPCAAKQCDGKNPSACDVYVGSSSSCSAATCIDGVGTPQAMCLADGGCETVVPQVCAPYACVAGACASSCTDDADCSPGDYCNVTSGTCIVPPASTLDAGSGSGSKSSSSGCTIGDGPGNANADPWAIVLGATGLCLAGARRRRARGERRGGVPLPLTENAAERILGPDVSP